MICLSALSPGQFNPGLKFILPEAQNDELPSAKSEGQAFWAG